MIYHKNVLAKVIPAMALGALQNSYPKTDMQYRRPTATKTHTTKKTKRATTSLIKQTVLRMADTKHMTQDNNQIQVAALLQSNIYSNCITAQVVQGTANNNRIGDEIYLHSLKINGYYQCDTASSGYMARIIVGWSGLELNNTTGPIPVAGSLAAADIFLPSTIGGNSTCGIINPKTFTVLSDTIIDLNSQLASAKDLVSFQKDIKLSGKFPYRGAGSVYGRFKNLYIVFIGFVPGGTPNVTTTGFISASYDLMFKDV